VASRSIKINDLEIEGEIDDRPVQSGFDYLSWPVIKPTEWGFEIANMEWGFLPSYVFTREHAEKFRKGYTDERGKYHVPMTTLNAKGEELLLPGKMYRDAALNRRCVIVASSFYEWRHIFPIGKKGLPLKTAIKYPYSIRLRDLNYLFIAGIWQPWTDRNTGETVETLSLVTTDANSLMAQIHNSKKRMPTTLTPVQALEWMTPDLTEGRITKLATFKIPSGDMIAHTIRKDFRSIANPIEEFIYPEVPAPVM